MFTIKLYTTEGLRQRIFEAESFTILQCDKLYEDDGKPIIPIYWSEVTAHVKSGDDMRFDIGSSPYHPNGGVWEKCIIENSAGRTTQIIGPNAPKRSTEAA